MKDWGCLKPYKPLKDNGEWLTPPDVLAELDAEFEFDFDPCPYPRPDWDGLKVEWGQSSYVNPPFKGNPMAWVHKSIEEHRKGKRVFFIYPIQNLIDELVRYGCQLRPLGQIPFTAPDGRVLEYGYPIMGFILTGEEGL